MAQATAIIGADAYTTNVCAGIHKLVSDEPESAGGQDKGPAPQELLASALASCTAITLSMYARRKGLGAIGIEVNVEVMSDADTGKNVIRRSIKTNSVLDAEQQKRFVQMAEKCPVSKMLSGGVNIQTEIA